jgi:hypothetical protein
VDSSLLELVDGRAGGDVKEAVRPDSLTMQPRTAIMATAVLDQTPL